MDQESSRSKSAGIESFALLILLGLLVVGAFLRLRGSDWALGSMLHPDERFYAEVTSRLQPLSSWGDYFNTEKSTLNPEVHGYTFFVYGTLPLFLTKLVGTALEGNAQLWMTDYIRYGRMLSALMDLIAIGLTYLLGRKLFDWKIGLLGAAFTTFAVLQIQQSHFYTSDSFSITFVLLALYFSACLIKLPIGEDSSELDKKVRSKLVWYSIGFGAATGLAMASKLNTAVIAFFLPLTWLVIYLRASKEVRSTLLTFALEALVFGGTAAFLVFRIFQPYAFKGPGFFGIGLNQNWIDGFKSLAAQMSGDIDSPPALQWARRNNLFSWTNMVLWGLGLPLGLTATAGLIWLGLKQLKGAWKTTLVFWLWTALYLIWQSRQGNPTMRYELPIYPCLAILAAWTIFQLWEVGKDKGKKWVQAASIALGIGVLGLTVAWAFAFSGIYSRPITRVAASEWIYQNISGPVRLTLSTGQEEHNQNISFIWPAGENHNSTSFVNSQKSVIFRFRADHTGKATSFQASYIQIGRGNFTNEQPMPTTANLKVILRKVDTGETSEIQTENTFSNQVDYLVWKMDFPLPMELQSGAEYEIELQSDLQNGDLNIKGPMELLVIEGEKTYHQVLPTLQNYFDDQLAATYRFIPEKNGALTTIHFNRIGVAPRPGSEPSIVVSLSDIKNPDNRLFERTLTPQDYLPVIDVKGIPLDLYVQTPISLDISTTYELKLELTSPGSAYLEGSTIANETVWDDGLPTPLNRYDPYGSFYPPSVLFQMYWPEAELKRELMKSVLERSDYIVMSSNRQWGTTVRVPERYPMATAFYRNLIGCPEGVDILYCYRTGEAGSYAGKLGFELIYTADSNPTLGPIEINDQFAEEAFTVYDHPKVLIFQKTPNFDSKAVGDLLESIDLTNVVETPAMKIQSAPSNMMLPEEMVAKQQASGTWSDLFDANAPWNRNPWLAALIWYLFFFVLSWLVYPVLRIVMKSMPAKGYAFAKLAGLLLLSWMVWFGSSYGIPFTKSWIGAAVAILALTGSIAYSYSQKEIVSELKADLRQYLTIEFVSLVLFIGWLLVRWGNPDLWHPWKGGEKPMDFAYLNAVIKSVQFPPYNPWYSGAWINYYYYGFVLAAVPIKLLGILPSIGYNLVEAIFFCFTGMAAYGVGTALHRSVKTRGDVKRLPEWLAGVTSAVFVLIIGNLGTLKLIWEGFQRMAAPNGVLDGADFVQRLSWFAQGIGAYARGMKLPIPIDWWYWNPSRVLEGGNEINEFPFFTFLYGDPHAHMFALGITIIALGWVLSIVLNRGEGQKWPALLWSLFFGAVTIGALFPTNTWDSPTYSVIAVAGLIYAGMRHQFGIRLPGNGKGISKKVVLAVIAVIVFYALTKVLYQPFSYWFAQAYSKLDLWTGNHTTFKQFFTHWGVFYTILGGWLIYEVIDWLANEPASSLRKLKPYSAAIKLFTLFVVLSLVGLVLIAKIPTAVLSLTLGLVALILLFRREQPDSKRFVLFLVGSGAMLAFMVEVVVLVGDIARMNTVFKIYLQVWVLWGIASAAALIWMLERFSKIKPPKAYSAWLTLVFVLLFSGLLYPLTATSAKLRDRMATDAPRTLDGMTYMTVAHQNENGIDFALRDDYDLIRWMQANIQGTPVILEGNLPLYHWGNRISIYTGLPVPIGWDWHQRQQRMTQPETNLKIRLQDTADFYTLPDVEAALKVLKKYNVKYFVVGEPEHIYYPVEGLSKFPANENVYWKAVFSQGNTVLYEVLP